MGKVAGILFDTILDRVVVASVLILVVIPSTAIARVAAVLGLESLQKRSSEITDSLVRKSTWY
jgi:hypothetical protein